jgi:exonuclease VII small subunit
MNLIISLLLGMTVSAKIDTVIVYSNQVVVVRTASVTLNGSTEITLPGLPGALDNNSVRVRAPGLRIGEVQIKPGYLAEPTPEVKRLENRVRALEDSLRILEDEAAVLKAKEDFLNSIKLGTPEIIARELREGKVAPESWRGALNFVAEELTKVKIRAITLSREQTETRKRLDAARQELTDARALIENRKLLRFVAEGEPGSYRLVIAYSLPRAANWQPITNCGQNRVPTRLRLTTLPDSASVPAKTGKMSKLSSPPQHQAVNSSPRNLIPGTSG